MLRWSYCLLSTILFLSTSASALAQEAQPKPSSTGKLQSRLITASAAADSIRFASLGELVQMRLEVIGASGQTLFDSDFKPGNLIDWAASDEKGQRLADGTYLCVVSVKDSSGQVTRKQAIASLQNLSLGLRQSESALLSEAQAQAAGANGDEDVSLTILDPAAPAATAVVAHDGKTAHLVSGSGGLSISSGDFFANKLLEQMRLTVEGNLGIGTTNPEAKLDVAGLIRSGEGIVFPDGSIQYSASRKTFGVQSLKPGQSKKKGGDGEDVRTTAVDVSGTGTTGTIPKWLDGPAGELDDSNITEVSGAIGINGEPSTSFRLDVNGSTRIRGSNPGFNLVGLRPDGNEWVFQTVDDDGRFRLFGQDNVNPGVERFTISLSTGNVGIGETNPLAKLDVGGAINTSAQYNIGGNPVVSLGAGADNLFVGPFAGQANPTGTANSFFGVSAGFNTTTGAANAFFGRSTGFQNTTGTDNSFFGVQAGRDSSTGVSNSFFGRAAGIGNGPGNDNSYFGAFTGQAVSTGNSNSFFGVSAGFNNTGSANAFFGRSTGFQNTTGIDNSFFGTQAGRDTGTGASNSFFGRAAGIANATGTGNTIIGANANVGAGNLTNATAIGANTTVSQSNSLILGNNANVGIGTSAPTAKLHVFGTAKMNVLELAGGLDLAEHFEIGDGGKPGLVVAIDPQNTGRLSIARGAYNRRVAGIISGANNLSAGMTLTGVKQSKESMPIALSGRVWVYCDATRHAIRPGDLLTTSNTAGHAMKVISYSRAQGAVIGKAMTGLKSGRGLVLVLVTLQ